MQRQSEVESESVAILARSPRGMILSCPCCDRYEIRLGNAVFEMPPHLLHELARVLREMEFEPHDPQGPRPHLLKPCEDAPVAFAFSEGERMELQSLVDEVLAIGPTFGFAARVHCA